MNRYVFQFLTILVCVLGYAGGVGAVQVVIVESDRSAGYVETAAAVVAELERVGIPRSDVEQVNVADLARFDSGAALPRVFVSLGLEALRPLLSREFRVPVLAALIPRSGFERMVRNSVAPPPVTALYLDQPFTRQLDLLRIAIPTAKRVGVLWGPESVKQQATLSGAATARGLVVVNGYVAPDGGLYAGLKMALDDVDVLLAVADPQVFNGSTIANILLSTYRARIPVLAFSPAYVKAGALLSLHTTPLQVGSQAANMARGIVQRGLMPGPQYSLEFEVSVNEHVARSLGLLLDAAMLKERLRRLEKLP